MKTERHPAISRPMMMAAVSRAQSHGHDMTAPVRDAGAMDRPSQKDGYVAYCRTCDGYVVVDIDESPRPYGRATEGRCTGRPPVQPAARREVSLERPAFHYPPPILGWTEAEMLWVARMVPGESLLPGRN